MFLKIGDPLVAFNVSFFCLLELGRHERGPLSGAGVRGMAGPLSGGTPMRKPTGDLTQAEELSVAYRGWRDGTHSS